MSDFLGTVSDSSVLDRDTCAHCKKTGPLGRNCPDLRKVDLTRVVAVVSRCSMCNIPFQVEKPNAHSFDHAGELVDTEALFECIVTCQGSVSGLPARVMLDSGCSTVGFDESLVSLHTDEVRLCRLFGGHCAEVSC